jgi:hypothetical protein
VIENTRRDLCANGHFMKKHIPATFRLSRHLCAWGLCLTLIPVFAAAVAAADGPMGVERIARLTSLGYQSMPADNADEIRWVQVDLGESRTIETVKLFPKLEGYDTRALNSPVRFCLECSDASGLKTATKIADYAGPNYPAPGDVVAFNRWHSALTPHPHWIEVKLPKPEEIGRVVIRFADPAGFPVSFQGMARVNGTNQVIFSEAEYENWRDYRCNLKPVVTDTFCLLIRASANTAASSPDAMTVNPNGAQISEIELYPPKY